MIGGGAGPAESARFVCSSFFSLLSVVLFLFLLRVFFSDSVLFFLLGYSALSPSTFRLHSSFLIYFPLSSLLLVALALFEQFSLAPLDLVVFFFLMLMSEHVIPWRYMPFHKVLLLLLCALSNIHICFCNFVSQTRALLAYLC